MYIIIDHGLSWDMNLYLPNRVGEERLISRGYPGIAVGIDTPP